MSSLCERCGLPAPAIDTASHAFCDDCAARASTGARTSSELLFSLRPPPLPSRTAAVDPEDRISLPMPGAIVMPVPTIAPPAWSAKRAFFTALPYATFIASALLFVGAASLALDAREREARMVSIAESAMLEHEVDRVIPDEVELDLAPAGVPVAVAPSVVEPAEIEAPARRPRLARRAPAPELAPPAPVETEEALPAIPTRESVRSALRSVEAEVALCSDGSHGTANTRITFLGRTGAASHAEVFEGPSPEVRSCIARAARGAELPRFSQERFTVVFPYRY